MKNKRLVYAVLGGVMLSGIAAQPAYADSSDYYVEQAINSLSSSPAYVNASSVTPSAVLGAIDANDLAVVVLPADSVGGSLSPADMAREILNGVDGKYDTVLVYQEGGRNGFASRDYDLTELSTAAYAPFNDGGTLQENIIESIDAVEALPVGGSPVVGGDAEGGFDFGALFIVLAAAALVTGAGVALARFFVRRPKQNATKALPSKVDDSVPNTVAQLMKQLRSIIDKHEDVDITDIPSAFGSVHRNLAPTLRRVYSYLEQLFVRIERKGTPHQVEMAETEYADKLAKLNKALGDDYYLDIIHHDALWDNAESRVDAIAQGVEGIQYQLVENIKQVNASRDLEFQVALDSLVKEMQSASNIKSLYGKKEN